MLLELVEGKCLACEMGFYVQEMFVGYTVE